MFYTKLHTLKGLSNMQQLEFLAQRRHLVEMARQSYQEGLFAGTSGNLSTYDPETGIMTITPTSVSYHTMTEEDAVCLTLDGNIVWGSYRPSSEWQMHAYMYENMPDIRAVVHTHSPYATSFAVNHEMIPVILIEMVPFLGGAVPVSQFAIPGTVEMGVEALKAIEDVANGCLLANHGVLTVGRTLNEAYIRAVYVEDAAKIYSLAKSNGPVHTIEEQYIQAMKNRMQQRKG